MTVEARLATLSDVFRKLRMPLENRPVVEAYAAAIGISGYFERAGYVLAERRSGGPSLRIAYGWVNGFIDEEEIRAAVGDRLDAWQSDERAPLWGAWHPVNRAHAGNGASPRRKGAGMSRSARPRDLNGCQHPPLLGEPCAEAPVDEINGKRFCAGHAPAARVDARFRALLEESEGEGR